MRPYEPWASAHLQKLQVGSGLWSKALCPLPGHDDRSPSFSINLDTGGWRCHVCERSGHIRPLARELGLPTTGLPDDRPESSTAPPASSNGSSSSSKLTPETEYIYEFPAGTPVMKVVRYRDHNGDKTFRQFSSDGKGEWKKGTAGLKVPLFGQELLATRPEGAPVWWVEGEKDALWGRSRGLLTVSSAMGAGNLGRTHRAYLELFRGLVVNIIPDNDEPGRRHAQDVARALKDIAEEVRIVELPEVPEKGDLADWINLGGTREQLDQLAAAAPVWEEKEDEKLPVILAPGKEGGRDFKEIVLEATAALERSNRPPRLFVHGGVLKRFRVVSSRPVLDELNVNSILNELASSASWLRERNTKSGTYYLPCFPDKTVAAGVLSLTSWPLPELDQVVETPVFGPQLVQTSGYHPSARVYLHSAIDVPTVPSSPSAHQVEKARKLILDEVFGDFPWVGEASRANLLASQLLPFVRPIIGANPTPMHLFEATTQGSGKSLAAAIVATIATGRPPVLLTEGKDDDDWRKRITATLMDGPAVICLDNIRDSLESANLAAAITSDIWTDRVLGLSSTVYLPNRTTWLLTANAPKLSTDNVRRSLSIRLDPRTDQPWKRTGWRHPNLKRWVIENRPQLVWACLVLCQAWVAAGQPSGTQVMGSFERWSEVMGGILDVVGQPGFLANADDLYERSDSEASEWRRFVQAWRARFTSTDVTASDLLMLLEANPELLLTVIRGNTERGRLTSLGTHLGKQVDRVFGEYVIRLASAKSGGVRLYRLERLEDEGTWGTSESADSKGPPEESRTNTESEGPRGPRGPFSFPTCETHFGGGTKNSLHVDGHGKGPLVPQVPYEELPDGGTLW